MEARAGTLIVAAALAIGAGADRVAAPLLVVESAGTVVVVRANGERERLAAGGEPAVSPDARRVAFSRDGAVYVLPLAGGRAEPVATGTSPAWSPDGRLAVAAADGVRVDGRLVPVGRPSRPGRRTAGSLSSRAPASWSRATLSPRAGEAPPSRPTAGSRTWSATTYS
jgi:hypothetical protein